MNYIAFFRGFGLLSALVVALAGCASQAPAATSTAASVPPTATVPAEPTTALPAAPTSQPPAQGNLLPLPLYLNDNGQIARIERDGQTRTLVTNEQVEIAALQPISTFAVSPAGDLAYVVGDLSKDRLVQAGPLGEEPRILYSEEGHELSDLLWSPDGQQIYLRLLNNREPPDTPSGVYRIGISGGALELVLADDEVTDPVNPSPALSGYAPFAWSPDAASLLVEIESLFYEGCAWGIMPTAGGDMLRLTLPEGQFTNCGEASWSPDSSSIVFLAGPNDGTTILPTLWRGSRADGSSSPLVTSELLARSPHALADGGVGFFLVRLNPVENGLQAEFTMAQLAAAATEPQLLGQPFTEILNQNLWAPDASGVVMVVQSNSAEGNLLWQAAGGEITPLPGTNQSIGDLAWGVE